jgi:hypothetical protein
MKTSPQSKGRVRGECRLHEASSLDLCTFRTDCRGKVSAVRRQLRQGKYDIDSRLAAVIDRILEDLIS